MQEKSWILNTLLVRGEIGSRRIVVSIGQEPKFYIFMTQVFFRKVGLLRKESVLRTEQAHF